MVSIGRWENWGWEVTWPMINVKSCQLGRSEDLDLGLCNDSILFSVCFLYFCLHHNFSQAPMTILFTEKLCFPRFTHILPLSRFMDLRLCIPSQQRPCLFDPIVYSISSPVPVVFARKKYIYILFVFKWEGSIHWVTF